jgi:hypothetical protein
VEGNVDRAVLIECRLEHASNIVGISDICLNGKTLHLGSNHFSSLEVHVDDDNIRTLRREAIGRRTSDATASTGDDGSSVGKALHD